MGRNLFSGVRFLTAVSVLAITIVVPASAKQLSEVKPNRQGMSAERLQRVTDMAQRYVDEGRFAVASRLQQVTCGFLAIRR